MQGTEREAESGRPGTALRYYQDDEREVWLATVYLIWGRHIPLHTAEADTATEAIAGARDWLARQEGRRAA